MKHKNTLFIIYIICIHVTHLSSICVCASSEIFHFFDIMLCCVCIAGMLSFVLNSPFLTFISIEHVHITHSARCMWWCNDAAMTSYRVNKTIDILF